MIDPTARQLRTQPRYRVVAHVRATQPDCWLCGYPIHVDTPPRTPLASTVDELVPRSKGGSAIDLHNVAHAHLTCNSIRGNRDVTADVRDACRRRVAALTAQPVTAELRSTRSW